MTYNTELRQAVVRYYRMHKGNTDNFLEKLKSIFGISIASLYNWIHLEELNNSLDPKIQGRPKGSGKITIPIKNYIVTRFTSNNRPTMKNLKRSIMRIFQVPLKKSAIYRALHESNITYKKVSVNRYPYGDAKLAIEKKQLQAKLNDMVGDIVSYDEIK